MAPGAAEQSGRIRAAEVIASLSLATDLGVGLPFEHGLQSTLVAMRLADRLGVDPEVSVQTYYGCLLFYVGCTADADVVAATFGTDDALLTHWTPVMFGSRLEVMGGVMRALESPETPAGLRQVQAAGRLPKAFRQHQEHRRALCEVARMLTDRLGMPASVRGLFDELTERWDGSGERHLGGEEISLPLRIIHVARDATLHYALGGVQQSTEVIADRSGHAFDPQVASVFLAEPEHILEFDAAASAWDDTLDREPRPHRSMDDAEVDRALAAVGDFADLVSPFLVGHSSGVAALATSAARDAGLDDGATTTLGRAAMVHDIGRVGVPARIWLKPGPLNADDWERVRLHAYQSERVLTRSRFLSGLAATSTSHHERMDGSGYHRRSRGADLSPSARLLCAADAYHAMTEPRAYRPRLSPADATAVMAAEVRAGRFDGASVAAVLSAAGQPRPRLPNPAGLTDRECEVVGLLARGLQTKQVARTLGISAKTADRHIQNVYGKIGVSTRAAAALVAMEHGLTTWGELPIVPREWRS